MCEITSAGLGKVPSGVPGNQNIFEKHLFYSDFRNIFTRAMKETVLQMSYVSPEWCPYKARAAQDWGHWYGSFFFLHASHKLAALRPHSLQPRPNIFVSQVRGAKYFSCPSHTPAPAPCSFRALIIHRYTGHRPGCISARTVSPLSSPIFAMFFFLLFLTLTLRSRYHGCRAAVWGHEMLKKRRLGKLWEA